jgi:hypothetical protein
MNEWNAEAGIHQRPIKFVAMSLRGFIGGNSQDIDLDPGGVGQLQRRDRAQDNFFIDRCYSLCHVPSLHCSSWSIITLNRRVFG